MKTKLISILTLMISLNAFALPVLRESSGEANLNFVTIYPDDTDPNKFYFMPNTMNFAMDRTTKLPRFSLLTYGIEQADLKDSFGFMTFTFRAALTDDVRAEIDLFMKKHPQAVMATMPVAESYLSVGESRNGTPDPAALMMFKKWELPPFGGLLETEVGGNAYLTGIGAKMLVNAIKDGRSQIGQIQSCYTIDGVTPEMSASIKINYQKVFEHFRTKASVGWWIFGADVVSDVKNLQESGHIEIKVHGDTKMEDATMEMARQLAKEYLAPTLENQAASNDIGNMPFRMIRFGFSQSKVEERKEVTYTFNKRVSIKDVRCVAAPLSGLTPYSEKLISNTPK